MVDTLKSRNKPKKFAYWLNFYIWALQKSQKYLYVSLILGIIFFLQILQNWKKWYFCVLLYNFWLRKGIVTCNTLKLLCYPRFIPVDPNIWWWISELNDTQNHNYPSHSYSLPKRSVQTKYRPIWPIWAINNVHSSSSTEKSSGAVFWSWMIPNIKTSSLILIPCQKLPPHQIWLNLAHE